MTNERRIPCVYLTGSLRGALAAKHLLAAVHVRVHRAASLDEAILVLRTVKGLVLLVDYSFPGGTWRDALRVVSQRYPEASVVVAVAVRRAPVWEHVFMAGGFEVVLKPFDLQELGPVLREADSFSREFLSASARVALEAGLPEFGAKKGGAVDVRSNFRWYCGTDAGGVGGTGNAGKTFLTESVVQARRDVAGPSDPRISGDTCMFRLIPILTGKRRLSWLFPLAFLGEFFVVAIVILLFALYASGL